MRRFIAVWSAVSLVLLLLSPSALAQPPEKESWIVTLAPGVDPGSQAEGLSRQVAGESRYVYRHVLNGFSFRGSAKAAAALERNPNVLRVQPSGVYEMTDQDPTGVLRIGARAASELGHTGRMSDGTRVRVAVLDTGVMADHDDLRDNVVEGEGRNCFDAVPPGDPVDDQGHGTHVAGTVGAVFDGAGVVGVATEVSIAAVKVLDSQGVGSDEEVICGLDHVAALAADGIPTVINLSLGEERIEGTGCASSPLHQAICDLRDQNLLVVAAMGNNGADGSNFYPAAFPETIGVSAFADLNGAGGSSSGCQLFLDTLFQCDESLANFTNWGSAVDVAAPGVNIMSTTNNGGWGNNSGTSMASPHVAGVAALVLAADPSLTPDEVRTVLQETGECPDGSTSGAATCDGHGQWQMSQLLGGTVPDPDGIPEPLVDARAAAVAAAGGADDVVPPVITLNPPNPQLVTIGNAYPEFGAGAVDDRDGDLSPAIVIDASAVDTSTVGTYPVTYDVSDSSGNATQVVRSVEVVSTPDLSPPVLTLNGPAPQVIAQGDPYVELGATAIDSFDGDLSTAVAVDASAVDTSTPGSYPVTYDVADSSGNAATQLVRTVDVVADDRTAPIITLLGEAPQTVVQGFLYVESGATAFDDVDGDVSASIVIDASAADTSTPGSFQVTYEASDAAGNVAVATRTVDVVTATAQTSYLLDFAAMNITPLGTQDVSSSMAVEDDGASLRVTGNGWKKVHLPTVITPNTMLEFDFSSSARGEVHGVGFDNNELLSSNWTFKVYGTQDWGITDFANYPGSGVTHYTIPVGQYFTGTFNYLVFATDHDVSSPTAESLISNVELHAGPPADVTPPEITLVGDDPQTLVQPDVYVELGATAVDDVDGDVSGAIVIDATAVDTSTAGSYDVTYNVSDAAGNPAVEVVRVVEVVAVPHFTVQRDTGDVWGEGWEPNSTVTVSLTSVILPADSFTVAADGSGAFASSGGFGYELDPGDEVTVDDGISTHSLVLSDVAVTLADPTVDMVTGTAAPGSNVQVGIATESVDLEVPADGSTGDWIADFSAVYDILPGDSGDAIQYDSDGDGTQVNWVAGATPPPPVGAIDFSAPTVVESYGGLQDAGSAVVSGGGYTLTLSGNVWKKIALPTSIQAGTVLEFDFSSSVGGEIQGIGFDTDDVISFDRTFQVAGSQTWGLQDYRSYVSPGVTHYEIPVGLFYGGDFDFLFFVNDHDVAPSNAVSVFTNVVVTTPPPPVVPGAINFSVHVVSSYGGLQDAGTVEVLDGGFSLRLSGNAWKRIALPTSITPSTMLEFDFLSPIKGEIQGIGFDIDDVISSDRTFELYGGQTWGLQDWRTYVAPGVTHYSIPIGTFYTGEFEYLFFVNDHDGGASNAESVFTNVVVVP